jgi:hypothetical protein
MNNKQARYISKFSMLIVLSQFTIACSSTPMKTYEGEERSINDVAVIVNGTGASSKYEFSEKNALRKGFSFRNGYIVLRRIDNVPSGEEEGTYYYHSSWDGALNVSVLPGRHTLRTLVVYTKRTTSSAKGGVLRLARDNFFLSSDFPFDAEKGHVYLVSFFQYDQYTTPVVLDLTDWKKVYPPGEIVRTRGALMGPGVYEWIEHKRIRRRSASDER